MDYTCIYQIQDYERYIHDVGKLSDLFMGNDPVRSIVLTRVIVIGKRLRIRSLSEFVDANGTTTLSFDCIDVQNDTEIKVFPIHTN